MTSFSLFVTPGDYVPQGLLAFFRQKTKILRKVRPLCNGLKISGMRCPKITAMPFASSKLPPPKKTKPQLELKIELKLNSLKAANAK